MKTLNFLLVFVIFFLAVPFVSSAHFIVGNVNDANDGASADGKTVVMWNPSNGITDNETDTVGPTGNSGANNIYLMDCELLSTPCQVGDEIRVQVIDNGDGYFSSLVNVTVSGLGFDTMPNITLNSLPTFQNISVDDSFSVPVQEIDLTPAVTTEVLCEGVVTEYDGNSSLSNITAEFFDNTVSAYGANDDNNFHYSNSSCTMDLGYGNENETSFSCGFQVQYYSNSGNWNCTVRATDNISAFNIAANTSNINTLLALGLPDTIDYGTVNASAASAQREANVTNYGNVIMNLSLSGYGSTVGDGNAMNCSGGSITNISVGNQKYNLTFSNESVMNSSQLDETYRNLTWNATVNRFDLNFRQNDTDATVDAINSTFWRIFVPVGTSGTCWGNIVFGAVQAPES